MESPIPPNPYKTLNVAKDASLATIRSAHRKLVLTCHPDKVQDEAVKAQKSEQFHQVQQAYEILSDETRRQRYDDQVKLAELRAETMNEKGVPRAGPGGASEFFSRSGSSPIFEVRNGRVYEERMPSRSYEDDIFASKFKEHQSPSKKHDDYYGMPSSRRSSGRIPEEKRRFKDVGEERDLDKDYRHSKEAEKKANHGSQKKKDKDRRKDREAKFTSKSAFVEDADSDSDITEPYYPLRREAAPKHKHEEPRRRSSRRDDTDRPHKDETNAAAALDYMERSRRSTAEVEPRRSDSSARHYSPVETRPMVPPPPPLVSVDTGRRTSGRSRESRRASPIRISNKDRRTTEIVDTLPARRPSVPMLSSDPRGLKTVAGHGRGGVSRSLNVDSMPETRHPMRRSDTMPVPQTTQRRSDGIAANSSRLKSTEINDSGYSSSGTPDTYQAPSPHLWKTKYQINEDEDDPRIHNIVYIEPVDFRRERDRERDVSPRTRRQTDRPAKSSRGSSNTRGPPPRSMSYAFATESVQAPRPPPSMSRTESARAPPLQSRQSSRGGSQLFGEYSPPEEYKVVNQLPKIRADDIKYSHRSPRDAGRDAYPGSHFDRHRPGFSRHESRAIS